MIDIATKKVVEMNGIPSERVSYLWGSWEQLAEDQSLKDKVDIILMCETLYNKDYFDSLANIINHCLKKSSQSVVILGTKTFYYGFSGGYYDFEKYIKANHSKYGLRCDTVLKINDLKSIER